MLSKQEVIEILRKEQAYLKQQFGVKKIAIFGSFATDSATAESDVDIYVEFQKSPGMRFLEMSDYLESKLGRKTDILTKAGVDSIRVKRIADEIKNNIIYV